MKGCLVCNIFAMVKHDVMSVACRQYNAPSALGSKVKRIPVKSNERSLKNMV